MNYTLNCKMLKMSAKGEEKTLEVSHFRRTVLFLGIFTLIKLPVNS